MDRFADHMPNPVAHNLLIDCLSTASDPTSPSQLSQLSDSEWHELARIAEHYGVGPLLYHRLTSPTPGFTLSTLSSFTCNLGQPPLLESVLQPLRETFLVNTIRNQLIYQDLATVVTTLQKHGIRVAALKGAHLAALVYRHLGLRTMADLDILVDRKDLVETATLLRELGYDSYSSQSIVSQAQSSQHLDGFFKPRRVKIEVHWAISCPKRPYKTDIAGVMARLCPVTLAGVQVYVLSPVDLLLHLCIHEADHLPHPFSQGLRPLLDLAVTIEHYDHELDWLQVQLRAVEWRAQKAVYVGLRLARGLVGAKVPRSVLDSLRPQNFNEGWYALARDQVMRIGAEPPPAGGETAMFLASALSRSDSPVSLSTTLRLLFRAAFPNRRAMAGYMQHVHSLPLKGARKYTCYLTRALDWTGRGLCVLRHWVRHRSETNARVKQLEKLAQFRRWLVDLDSKL